MLFLVFCVEEVRGDGAEWVIQSSTHYVYSMEAISYLTRPKATSLTVNNTWTSHISWHRDLVNRPGRSTVAL